MRKILDIFGLFLVLQGVGGIVHHFVGWFRAWGLLARAAFLHGYQLPAGFALIVLGFLVWVLGETLLPTEKERRKKASSKSAVADVLRQEDR
ncbi:hypothetical protein [Embleya hyalina]|uniref:Uncharacterized protein n=1 Tax=Embleya hyalina TaxID=516124 RepID=A0A401YU29_9ACTN|nr:hypothetical protein [Embleya hyalina]GCD98055.1 hypothetical protein EHYA_05755 [Embleya hyalina]